MQAPSVCCADPIRETATTFPKGRRQKKVRGRRRNCVEQAPVERPDCSTEQDPLSSRELFTITPEEYWITEAFCGTDGCMVVLDPQVHAQLEEAEAERRQEDLEAAKALAVLEKSPPVAGEEFFALDPELGNDELPVLVDAGQKLGLTYSGDYTFGDTTTNLLDRIPWDGQENDDREGIRSYAEQSATDTERGSVGLAAVGYGLDRPLDRPPSFDVEIDAEKVLEAFRERVEHSHALHRIATARLQDPRTCGRALRLLRVLRRGFVVNHETSRAVLTLLEWVTKTDPGSREHHRERVPKPVFRELPASVLPDLLLASDLSRRRAA